MAIETSYGVIAITSTTAEGILYGFSVLMFLLTAWVMLSKRGLMNAHHRFMFVAACLLLVFSTFHIAVNISRLFVAFIIHREYRPGKEVSGFNSSDRYLSDISSATFVLKDIAYVLQILVGDAVVGYRLYFVWRSIRIIVVPIILYLLLIATSIGSIYAFASARPPRSYDIFQGPPRVWSPAHLANTLAANLLSTLLLAYRLWSTERRVSGMKSTQRNSLLPILRVVVDSGLLYSAALIVVLACFLAKTRAQLIVFDLVTPIISIAFYAVILRVALVSRKNELSSIFGRSIELESRSQNARSQNSRRITGKFEPRLPALNDDPHSLERTIDRSIGHVRVDITQEIIRDNNCSEMDDNFCNGSSVKKLGAVEV